MLERCTRKICSRPLMSGRSTEICRSNRPGRIRARSRMSGLLVPANTTTPSFDPNPSISTNSWFKVFSRSSFPPNPPPRPRCLPMASISSMKMMEGACPRACANKSRTRLGPTPTNISMKSDPLMERNGTPLSPAVAFARSVFPVPGGPTSSAPRGIFAPRSSYFFGDFRKSTNSMISAFASSHPATSLNITFFAFLSSVETVALPTLKIPPPAPPPGPPIPPIPPTPPMRRLMKTNPARSNSVGAKRANSVVHATSLRYVTGTNSCGSTPRSSCASSILRSKLSRLPMLNAYFKRGASAPPAFAANAPRPAPSAVASRLAPGALGEL
mmetsp:Transcript_10262/g.43179  ORF Transcript_10262/g.43179 Transcript_10262/m.43179 type:complete len:328 (-) Transcript_10262:504-1487(-)